MRHQNKINQLSRKTAHRKALLSNLAAALITHKRINTTVAKAKALKRYVEPLLTKSKNDTTHSRRVVFSHLGNKEAVSELFREVAPKIGDRPGGYTRIIKTGFRPGDSAEMCMIELVDFNDVYTTDSKSGSKSKTRRSRRGGGKKTSETTSAKTENKVEEVKEEAAATEVKEEAKAPEAKAEEAAPEAKAEEAKKDAESSEDTDKKKD